MEPDNYTNKEENPEEQKGYQMTIKGGLILLGVGAVLVAGALAYMRYAAPKETVKIQPVPSQLEEKVSDTSSFSK